MKKEEKPFVAEILSIDSRDLLNLLRHAFLFGFNAGTSGMRASPRTPDYDLKEREEDINSLLEDLRAGRTNCFGEYPCSCSAEERGENPSE